jgi:hypothetical protein
MTRVIERTGPAHRRQAGNTGIGEHHIKLTEHRDGFGHGALDFFYIGQVSLDRQQVRTQCLPGFVEGFLTATGDCHSCAFSNEKLRGRQAQAAWNARLRQSGNSVWWRFVT